MKICPACGAEYDDDAAFCGRDRTPLGAADGGMIGRLLADRYQIERKIGEGGMGQVYLGRHVLMGRLSAIKVVNPSLTRDPDAISRFNREATNASRINHPNVCAVYDFGLTPDGILYLAMEYLEGRTLTEALAEGPLDLERALRITEQCAAGLTAAHELGIVHRDLKPDNAMLLEQRGRETVKLVDFGIAKAGTGEGARRVTQTGLVVGTPDYMSPEQLSSDEIDGRSDQYSLALMFYRMLTGAMPFAATSVQELMAKRLTEPPRTLAAVTSRPIPQALQEVMDRALSRKPADRFPTADAFAAALRTAAETSPVLPPTRVVARPAGRRWAAAAAVGGVAIVAGWGIWQWAASPAGAPGAAPAGPLPGILDSSTVPSSTVPPAVPPVPVPAPSPPPPAPPAPPPGSTAAIDVSSLPTLEDLEPSGTQTARAAVQRAIQAEASTSLSDSIRAEMGILIGVHALDMGRRTEAARAFRRACTRYSLTSCSRLLAELKDVP